MSTPQGPHGAASLQVRLKGLLDFNGPPPGAAEALLLDASLAEPLLRLLLRCLGDPAEAAVGGAPFTEGEAVSLIVRLLGTAAGDAGGNETFTAARCEEQSESVLRLFGTAVAGYLCSEALVLTVLELLQRRSASFERGEEPYLRADALKALRLQLLPSVLRTARPATGDSLEIAVAESCRQLPRAWWVEEEIGHLTHGSTRRQLVDILLHTLQAVSGGGFSHMGQQPQKFALCCLWTLAQTSAACRTLLVQRDVLGTVAGMLRAQLKAPGPPLESSYDAMCGLLAALGVGPRLHERKLAELRIDLDVVAMLERFVLYRQVVVAGFLLVGVVARDEAAAERLASSEQAMLALVAARGQWPDAPAEALRASRSTPAPLLQALADGAPLEKLRQIAAAPLRPLATQENPSTNVCSNASRMASSQRRQRSRAALRAAAARSIY
eukprot:TRINITY_DN49657_c0_g1_i1.p1 TRINITY_DN49657_c0_g1~~TRINITY_DN49657_c0_g1_i1.p1  ORF type:complete len:440 (-),score=110.65 TRINITY_DN49657_c0_g1_i1:198-1517(-)